MLGASRKVRARDEPLGAQAGGSGGRLTLLSFQSFDPRILDSSGLRGDTPRHVQIGRGPLQGQADRLYFDSCALRIGSLSQTVKVEAEFPPDRVTLGLTLDAPQPIRILGKDFASSDLTVFGPAEAIDVVFNAGTKWVTFNLPAEDYARELAAASADARLYRPQNAPRLRPGTGSAHRLRETLNAVETLAHRRPQLFGDAQWRLNAERSLKSGFFGLIENATFLVLGKGEARVRAARAIVLEAEATLEKEGMGFLSIAELCCALGVPRRTLERAFQEVVGFGPAAYFRIRALNAVRRALLDATPRPGMVARIAIDQGFWHLGRFAVSYRSQFGERPVDTLRRRGKSS